MKYIGSLVIIMVLTVPFANGAPPSTPPPPPPPAPPGWGDFDYYILSVEWPISFCKGRRCYYPRLPEEFTIHGLWPQKIRGTLVKSDEEFNDAEAKDRTRTTLLSYWINAKNQNERESFWRYQWEKHGRASGLKQDAYYDAMAKLYGQVRAGYRLVKEKYRVGSRVDVAQFAKEFKGLDTPVVECKSYTYGITNQVLLELRFMVFRNLTFAKDRLAKPNPATACGGLVLLPTQNQ